jgi:uncharacterized protein (DUF488 family)
LEIYTIGFAGKTAEQFFESLKRAGIQELVDVRRNNVSQLAGFTKRSDLPYFLNQVSISYRHELLLAPEEDDLKAYRAKKIPWEEYERRYLSLLDQRDVSRELSPSSFPERVVLLCSETTADKCHRRLAAEYFQKHWPNVVVHHL